MFTPLMAAYETRCGNGSVQTIKTGWASKYYTAITNEQCLSPAYCMYSWMYTRVRLPFRLCTYACRQLNVNHSPEVRSTLCSLESTTHLIKQPCTHEHVSYMIMEHNSGHLLRTATFVMLINSACTICTCYTCTSASHSASYVHIRTCSWPVRQL